jgi:hypothetical protein
LSELYTVKAYRRCEAKLSMFKTSALCGDEWSGSCFGCFIPMESILETGWALGLSKWGGGEGKILISLPEFEPQLFSL